MGCVYYVFHVSHPDKVITMAIVIGSDVTVSPQEEVFVAVGRPIIESCMGGYNGTIFA